MLSPLALQPTGIMLKTYTVEPLAPEGAIKVQVKLNKQFVMLFLDAPLLFGREWLGINYLNWKDLKIIHAEEQRENDNCG